MKGIRTLDVSKLDAKFQASFWGKVCDLPGQGKGDCWIWTRAKTNGYGVQALPDYGEIMLAHRISFALMMGCDVSPGMFVCHKCDVPDCVNPFHLFEGTAKDNSRDASRKGRFFNQTKTHCPKGHALEGENLRVWRGGRYCKGCERIRTQTRVYSASDKAKAAARQRARYERKKAGL